MKKEIPMQKSIFTKLILLFLIFIIPVYAIGYSIYTWGQKTIRKQINDSEVKQVDFFMESFENEMERIQTLQFSIFNYKDLNMLTDAFSILNNYDRDYSIIQIEDRLASIKNSSRYISEATIYIPSINKSISSIEIKDLDYKDFEMINAINQEKNSNLFLWNGQLFLNAEGYIPSNLNISKYPKFFFEIQLYDTEINDTLKNISRINQGGFILFRKDTDYVKYGGTDTSKVNIILDYLYKNYSNDQQKIMTASIENKKYIMYLSHSNYLNLTYVTYISQYELFKGFNLYIALFWLFSFATLILIVIFCIYANRVILNPLLKLLKAFKVIESGSINIEIKHNKDDEFKYIYHGFNQMTGKLSVLIEQVYKQKILVQKAELKQLQSQINPHFLFNSFFILSRRIKYGDLETANKLAEHLGTYFQFITRSATDKIKLVKEVEHARIYTEIQEARFSNRVKVQFDELPEEFQNIVVERLILQPLIENAFEYALESKVADGKLLVQFRKDGALFIISVEDNGENLSDENLETQKMLLETDDDGAEVTALINIHRRIRNISGTHYGLRLSRSELGGLKAELLIELKEGEDSV
jgi:two-component system sensor histidine kinase YesM